ncbi:hypothetical protein GCM10022419_036100 [Nonomuraea rosea]|uniref:LPXTG cell wall anchor domain-containing protein n=1 Tax=Nonomuraea rosea TaxID=638574 RepID=A0ABP6WL88_9ACTN
MRVELAVSAAVLILSYAPAAHGAAADLVEYVCTTKATGETQDVKVNVELTVPTDAEVGVEMSIGWRGTYVPGSELRAPDTGLAGEIKLYAYAGISSYPKLTSATGVAPLTEITAGEPIELPQTIVELKTTAKDAGSGTVHAASFNIGTTPQNRLIECEVPDKTSLMEYPLKVPGTGQSASPTPDTSETDDTETEDPESTPAPSATTTRTPSGGVQTGGGGEAGPDGRLLVGAGSVLFLASLTGLFLRRRKRVRPL